jgi:N-acetyl-gamma-glutamyl-phosphate reductase
MIRAGIAGGTGYVAGELLRILQSHPEVDIVFVYSHTQPGKHIAEVHQDLFASKLTFTDQIISDVDVVFLCLGHGQASGFLLRHSFQADTRIIDLSHDFRLAKDSSLEGRSFVYGLPELNLNTIRDARYVANPGCFATAIELALLPLAKAGLLNDEVHVHALTGSTGAGQSLSDTSHFSWRNNNISIYKAFSHQHLDEILECVRALQPGFDQALNFIPMRGDFTRGIFASVYTNCSLSTKELNELYVDFYQDAAFVIIYPDTIHLKQVVNTNYCLLQVQQIDGKAHITSVLDNLLKGASGQAVQNMNLMFGLDERMGLGLKANYF